MLAQEASCGDAKVIIEGGQPSPFVLPDDADSTLRVEPETVLAISATGVPRGSKVRVSIPGLGVNIDTEIDSVGPEPVFKRVDEVAEYTRGLYELKATLISGETKEVCTTTMRVDIEGFGGPVATAAVAVASAGLAAQGTSANLRFKLKSQLNRRRHGIRRFLPMPAGSGRSSALSWAASPDSLPR